MSHDEPGFSTLSIHAGARPDPTTGARITPIYQTTAFVFDDVDHAASLFGLQAFGNIYTRITNPTTAALEERVAALEGAPAALAWLPDTPRRPWCFMRYFNRAMNLSLRQSFTAVRSTSSRHAFKNFGWVVKWANPDEPESFRAALTDKTKAIFMESIANPGGVVCDVAAISAIAREAKIPLIVDNTLATPYLLRPAEHGADIIVHSATKYLGGHGNSMGGVIVDCGSFEWMGDPRYPMLSAPRPEYNGMVLAETFGNFAFAIACRVLSLRDLGPAISPFNAFLILNGIETLSLRMRRHCDNALTVAKHLASHEKVGWVSYAGLEGNPYHELANRLCPRGVGGVFTFGVKGGYDAGVALVSKLQLFSHVANFGDTRSLVIHPASTTHRQLTEAQKIAAGAGPDVVRLSVGLEDVEDLLADLDQALA